MTETDIFITHYNGTQIRTAVIGDETYVNCKDVANATGYACGASILWSLRQKEDYEIENYLSMMRMRSSDGQMQAHSMVNEAGLDIATKHCNREALPDFYLWALDEIFDQGAVVMDKQEQEEDQAPYADALFGSPQEESTDQSSSEEGNTETDVSSDAEGLEMITKTFQKQDVRVTEIDGAIHVAAADVADVLDYSRTQHFTRHVRPKYKGYHNLVTPGGTQEMLVISELGIYDGLSSAEGELAEQFQEWFHKHLREYRKGNVETSSSPDEKMIDSDAKQMVGLLREQLHQEERRQQEMADIRMLLEDIKANTEVDTSDKNLPATTGDGAPSAVSPTEVGRGGFNTLIEKCAKVWDCSEPLIYHQVYTQLFKRTGVDIYQIYFEGHYSSKLSVVVEEELLPEAVRIVKSGLQVKAEG